MLPGSWSIFGLKASVLHQHCSGEQRPPCSQPWKYCFLSAMLKSWCCDGVKYEKDACQEDAGNVRLYVHVVRFTLTCDVLSPTAHRYGIHTCGCQSCRSKNKALLSRLMVLRCWASTHGFLKTIMRTQQSYQHISTDTLFRCP